METPVNHPTRQMTQLMTDETNEEKLNPVPIGDRARRVLGVLVEKAKTVPDSYPMTLAAIVTGCNQKSNRAPKMDMDDEDVLLALDELRELGAAREIQGSGRAVKYRHAAYDWMDVDGPQAAVMTELLLRGPQTSGEIRSRASRMNSFNDLKAAQDVIDSLIEKDLIEAVTPAGRGQTFAHKLYLPEERQHMVAKIEKQAATSVPPPPKQIAAADKLVDRLEHVNERIDELERRIAELEG
jgi:uncharacterized protein YceH (UPF0502 family)